MICGVFHVFVGVVVIVVNVSLTFLSVTLFMFVSVASVLAKTVNVVSTSVGGSCLSVLWDMSTGVNVVVRSVLFLVCIVALLDA